MRLSIQEASHKLGVTEHTIRRRLRRGELKGEQVPRPQGFTWVVNVDETDLDDQQKQVLRPEPAQEPEAPVNTPAQPSTRVDVQPARTPPPAFSTAHLAELQALRARVAVLEERDRSKNDLINLLQDRLKSQDWQFGEVLNQLTDMQTRMLPPASLEIDDPGVSEGEQTGGGWLFWRRRRVKSKV